MAASRQQSLTDFQAGTGTQTVTQSIVFPLETSNTKTAKVETAVEDFADMCSYMGDMMASISPHNRSAKNPTLYRILTREFDKEKRSVKAKVASTAKYHVINAYKSYQESKDSGRPTFGDESFFKLDNQEFKIVKNERGFGIKANFIPYDPTWFHIKTRPYNREYLERICEGDADVGTAEFRLGDGGSVSLHLPVSWEIDVYKPADVNTTVGVDIGENVIYAAAVVGASGDVKAVEMQSGREFRHYREELQHKRNRLQQQGDLKGVKATRGDQRRYTEQVLDTASREIVDLSVKHAPATIKLEDLTHYRETADDPIHDWPFAKLQEKIAYKAKAEGLPVEVVNPRNTSITCRKCGQSGAEYRDGDEFECRVCGYEVHADVNAAINIANAE